MIVMHSSSCTQAKSVQCRVTAPDWWMIRPTAAHWLPLQHSLKECWAFGFLRQSADCHRLPEGDKARELNAEPDCVTLTDVAPSQRSSAVWGCCGLVPRHSQGGAGRCDGNLLAAFWGCGAGEHMGGRRCALPP